MNWPAVAVSLVIALAVSMFVRGGAFPFKLFFGIFTVFAIVFHLKPSLLGKLNESEKDDSDDESQRRIDSSS
jgi:hypothetical protein